MLKLMRTFDPLKGSTEVALADRTPGTLSIRVEACR
jgi:hypothetical protein